MPWPVLRRAVWACWGMVSALSYAGATPDQADVSAPERAALKAQRAQIDQRLHQAEAACYQRFIVEDCLRAERRKARIERASVHEQEAAIDAQARRQRADQRLQDIEGRIQAHSAAASPAGNAIAAPKEPASPQPRKVPAKPETAQARQQEHRRIAAERAVEAEQARARLIQKRDAAQAHRLQVERSRAEKNPPGRAPVAPLPAP
ncbi:MAG: hypothetical protein K2Q11_06900 [Burkholderiaceae bacterium]|nr:hypothetical protein [Burkholderiaceae bacterium]